SKDASRSAFPSAGRMASIAKSASKIGLKEGLNPSVRGSIPTSMASEFSRKLKSSSDVLDNLSGPLRFPKRFVGKSQPASAPLPSHAVPCGVKVPVSVVYRTGPLISPTVLPHTRLLRSVIPKGCGLLEFSLLMQNLPPVDPEAVPFLLMILLAIVTV